MSLRGVVLRGVARRCVARSANLRCARKVAYATRAFLLPKPYVARRTHRMVYSVVWRCVVLRCDPPGCSTFARYRSSLTDLSAPRISCCTKEPIVRHQTTLRGAALRGAGRELRCARHAGYAARGFPLPQTYVTFRRHRKVSYGMALRGVALRSVRLQHFRAIPFVLNRPLRDPNFTLH